MHDAKLTPYFKLFNHMHIHKKKSYAYIKSQNNFCYKNSALISSFIAQKVLSKKYKQKIT